MAKARITYTDHEGAAPVTTFHGVTFEDGKSVETDNAMLIAAADQNRWFKVTGASATEIEEGEVEAKKARRRGRPPIQPIGVPVEQDDPDAED